MIFAVFMCDHWSPLHYVIKLQFLQLICYIRYAESVRYSYADALTVKVATHVATTSSQYGCFWTVLTGHVTCPPPQGIQFARSSRLFTSREARYRTGFNGQISKSHRFTPHKVSPLVSKYYLISLWLYPLQTYFSDNLQQSIDKRQFCVFEPLLVELGATFAVHLKLIGKLLLDFQLVIIELFFARCHDFGATSKYRLKVGVLEGVCLSIWPEISDRRGRLPSTICARLDRPVNALRLWLYSRCFP